MFFNSNDQQYVIYNRNDDDRVHKMPGTHESAYGASNYLAPMMKLLFAGGNRGLAFAYKSYLASWRCSLLITSLILVSSPTMAASIF